MSEEVRHLGHALAVDDKIVRGSYSFRQGRLDDVPVVLVEAGIGKVNTALVATLLLDHFGCRSVLLTGVAGGIDPGLGIGDVVIADRLIQHDYGAVIGGDIKPFRPGVAPDRRIARPPRLRSRLRHSVFACRSVSTVSPCRHCRLP